MSNPNVAGTSYKTVVEDYDAAIDFTPWLTAGDTIDSVVVTCHQGTTDTSATMIGDVTHTDTTAVFEVKGGEAGKRYVISAIATTAQTDVWEAILYLVVS